NPRPRLPRSRRATGRFQRGGAAVAAAPLHGADRAGLLPARGHGPGGKASGHLRAGASRRGCPPRDAASARARRGYPPLGGRLGGYAPHGGKVHLLGEEASAVNALLAGVGWLDLGATATLAGGLLYGRLVAEPSAAGARALRVAAGGLVLILLAEFTLTALRMRAVAEIGTTAVLAELPATRWGRLWIVRTLG